jgi:hypothetical protein
VSATWCVGSEEAFYGSFASKEEAIAGAADELENIVDPGGTFYVGRCVTFVPRVDACAVIERLREEADESGGEAAEDWLEGAVFARKGTKDWEERADLEQRLTEALASWLRDTKQEPEFYGVEEITKHAMPAPSSPARADEAKEGTNHGR